MPAVAVDGSPTDHGGVITAITTRTRVNGELVVTVGALHACPIPGHGTNQVIEGSSTVLAEGMPVSRVGDACGCGATIVAGSPNVAAGG
ncbi:PAAR domain-containing protein [bacterium]|nr:PAAR domain-containing protein [bacterium]